MTDQLDTPMVQLPSPAPPSLRLVALTRLSTTGQEKGDGWARQEVEEIDAYATELGATILVRWSIVESATVFDRPAFQQKLAEAIELRPNGAVDGMIVGSVDRLARDPYDGAGIVREALRSGLRIFFASEQLDATREEDQILVLGALQAARAYAQRLKKQTAPARLRRAKVGKIPNGMVRWPFDYNPATGKATRNEERAAHVRAWVHILINGGTLADIQATMIGIPAPRGGVTWSRSTIRRILTSPELLGRFEAGHERMEAPSFFERRRRVTSTPFPVFSDASVAILTDEEFQAVQTRLVANKALSRRNTQHYYGPLHRRVRCLQCDCAFGVKPSKRDTRFACPKCRVTVNTVWLWNNVRNTILRVLCDPQRRRWFAEQHARAGAGRLTL